MLAFGRDLAFGFVLGFGFVLVTFFAIIDVVGFSYGKTLNYKFDHEGILEN